jgi:ssDNA-binding Zn-finger/Zn-ribbon topoisomerase 1
VILKEKEFTNPSDPRLRAGEEAEKQMAFYLQRAFRKRDDCFVINDLRVSHDGDFAWIDHLVVSTYGFFIVESKSAHVIGINEHGDWQRTYNNESTGMQSPVLQAQEQGRILKELLIANKEKLRGKIFFGKMQKGFKYCPIDVYIAISDNGIIQRGMDIPELFKADAVTGAITEKLAQLKTKANQIFLKNVFSTDVVWEMTKQEAQSAAEFLVSMHTPPALSVKSELTVAEANLKPISMQQPEKTFVPKVGAPCPECGQQKLIRKSINRSDGTETDFLACQGYPSTCKALFPLVAVVPKSTPEIKIVATPKFAEGVPCPKCGSGALTRRKGVKGRTDFWACTNYRKTKCNFKEPIVDTYP